MNDGMERAHSSIGGASSVEPLTEIPRAFAPSR